MTIPINKDPDTEYKNEFMFGYTLKEVLCVAAALLIIAGVTALAYFKFNIALNVGRYFGIPLAFPGIFRGALDVRASDIYDEMKMAAAQAIADIIKDDELNDEYIIPDAFDKRVAENVAKAVAKAARESGVARI